MTLKHILNSLYIFNFYLLCEIVINTEVLTPAVYSFRRPIHIVMTSCQFECLHLTVYTDVNLMFVYYKRRVHHSLNYVTYKSFC
jgi:hypothetical protein